MSTPDQRAYRDAMALYAAGVAVIAADDGARAHALTVSSFTSVSLRPPLLLACVKEESEFLPVVRAARRFSLNILREQQAALGKLFAAAPQPERLAQIQRTPGDSPRLSDALGPLARFDCALRAEHAAGDHAILVGEVAGLESDPLGRPLVWWRGALGPAPAPLDAQA